MWHTHYGDIIVGCIARGGAHLTGRAVIAGAGLGLGPWRGDLLRHRPDEALNLLPAAAGDLFLCILLLGCTRGIALQLPCNPYQMLC